MYKVFKATEIIGGSLKNQLSTVDRVLQDLADQLNDKDNGVESVIGINILSDNGQTHAVALVQVTEAKKK